MSDLKRCPFCGGRAELEQMGWPHHVFCTQCGAKTTSALYAEDGEQAAIAKWNRRSPDIIRCRDCRYYAVKDVGINVGGVPILGTSDAPTCTRWADVESLTDPNGFCFIAQPKDDDGMS